MKKQLLFLSFSFLWFCGTSFAEQAPKKSIKHLTQAHLGDTAYLVAKKELLLGLRQVSYGLLPYLSLETAPLYDMFGSWNVFTKFQLLKMGPMALAARLGLFYITLEQLPEVQNGMFYRYFIGGTASFRLMDYFYYHFNINNTSLHGNFITSKDQKLNMASKLTNIENDIEYRANDNQSILIGAGYDLSSRKFTLGASHLWMWSSLFLKLGLTFKTTPAIGMTVLPYFDLGIRI